MKVFKSDDFHALPHVRMWLIKRPDAYIPRELSELPKIGDIVEIDGEKIVVKSADFTGDSEFKYYPHIVIFAELES